MKCAYHPTSIASARCNSCERNLCPACDHRIKGIPYCQDCIVAGIEFMRRRAGSGPPPNVRQVEKSPLIAVMLGLIPGLGAAYNGQNVKALVHFVVTVGLATLADIFHSPLELVFTLATIASYFYSLYDAYRSTQRYRAGENLQFEDENLKHFLRERTNVWGGLLVGVGVLAAINIVFPTHLNRFWPLILIVSGLFFLRGYYRSHQPTPVKTVYRTPPPSVIPPNYDRPTNDLAGAESRFER